jgi:MFS family permease
LVTWSEIATNVGIVLGFLSGAIFFDMDEGRAWRAMFLLGIILPTIMIYLAIRVMPESPRWLVSKGRESEAKEVLEKVYPPGKLREDDTLVPIHVFLL